MGTGAVATARGPLTPRLMLTTATATLLLLTPTDTDTESALPTMEATPPPSSPGPPRVCTTARGPLMPRLTATASLPTPPPSSTTTSTAATMETPTPTPSPDTPSLP